MKGQLQLREDLVRTRSLSVTRWMQPPELYRYFGPRSEDRYVGFKALETVNHAVNYGCPMISQVNLMLTMQNDAKLFEEYSQVLCECVIAATGVWFFYSWNWCTFSAMCQCVLKSPSSWLNWFGPWAWDIGSQMQGFSRIAWPQTRWGGDRIWYLWRCGYRKVYHGINVPVATDDEFFFKRVSRFESSWSTNMKNAGWGDCCLGPVLRCSQNLWGAEFRWPWNLNFHHFRSNFFFFLLYMFGSDLSKVLGWQNDARSTRGAWSTSGMLYIPRKADQSLLEWRSVLSMAAGIRYRCPRSLGNSTNSSKSYSVVMDLHFATVFSLFFSIFWYTSSIKFL